MSAVTSSSKQRGGQKKGDTAASQNDQNGHVQILNSAASKAKDAVTSQWEYKAALVVVTILAFITRFYGISHPNQVVFDEVHFGKVNGKVLPL